MGFYFLIFSFHTFLSYLIFLVKHFKLNDVTKGPMQIKMIYIYIAAKWAGSNVCRAVSRHFPCLLVSPSHPGRIRSKLPRTRWGGWKARRGRTSGGSCTAYSSRPRSATWTSVSRCAGTLLATTVDDENLWGKCRRPRDCPEVPSDCTGRTGLMGHAIVWRTAGQTGASGGF